MLISHTLSLFVILAFFFALAAIFFAWRRMNRKPVEAQDWKRNRAETLWKDAVGLQSKGNFEKALEKWNQSAFMESDSSSPRTSFLGQVHNELGYCYYRCGLLTESEVHFKKALAFFRSTSFMSTFDTAFALNNYALLCMETGRQEMALKMIKRSLKIFSAGVGERAPQMVHVLNNLARSHMQVGAFGESLAVLEKALDIASRSLLPHYPESLMVKELLAETYQKLGKLEDAEKLYLDVVSTKETLHGTENPGLLPALHAMGKFYVNTGFTDKSSAIYERIYTIIRNNFGPEHHFSGEFLNQFGCLKIRDKVFPEARAMLAESLAILTRTGKVAHPAMLINIYLRLWLAHREGETELVLVLMKQAMVLMQISELAGMGGLYFHLAALIFDSRGAQKTAVFFGKQAVRILLTRGREAVHSKIVPDWLVLPSDKSIGQDLDGMLRRQQRVVEAQSLGTLFPLGRPVHPSLQDKVHDYLKAGWRLTEKERVWEEAMVAWQLHTAEVLYPKASEDNGGTEQKQDSANKKKPPLPKPEDIIQDSSAMAPVLEQLDLFFATLNS